MIRQRLKKWRLVLGQRLGGPGPQGVEVHAAMIKPYIVGGPFFERKELNIAGPKEHVLLRLAQRYPNLRWLQRIYAASAGQFWIPCPICDKPYGGHEWEESNVLITEREYFSDGPEDELFTQIRRTRSKGVCPDRGEEARMLNERWNRNRRGGGDENNTGR